MLNHCLSWDKFVNTHLSHSRQWFNIHFDNPTAVTAQSNNVHSVLVFFFRFNIVCIVLRIKLIISFEKKTNAYAGSCSSQEASAYLPMAWRSHRVPVRRARGTCNMAWGQPDAWSHGL